MNVALYGKPARWAMTERGRGALARTDCDLRIGTSAMRWSRHQLTIEIDENTVPLPSPLRGRIIVTPRGLTQRRFTLDTAGRHRWRPIAPLCDVTVDFKTPALTWHGTGYFDTNEGDEPLEAAFTSWSWSRFDLGDHARIFYDVVQRDGTQRGLSLEAAGAEVRDAPALPYRDFATTAWGIPRAAPCVDGDQPILVRTLENAPFYARSAIRSRIDGVPADGVHETLSLRRVASPLVRLMLPFRMFRRGGATV